MCTFKGALLCLRVYMSVTQLQPTAHKQMGF